MTYNFAQYIIDVNQERPGKYAMRDGTDDLTYGELSVNIKKVAQGLIQASILPGQTVTICMDDSVDWPSIFLGCLYMGAVPLSVSTSIGPELFWDIVEFAESKLIIADDAVASKLKDFGNSNPIITRQDVHNNFYSQEPAELTPHNGHPDTPSHMSLTSGSSGMPKIAMIRHQTLFDVVEWWPKHSVKMNSDSIMMSLAKMSWNYGLQNSLTTTFGIGATAIVVPGLPNPTKIFNYANRYLPTVMVTSTSVAKKLLGPASNRFKLPDTIKEYQVAGEMLTPAVYNQFVDKFNIRLSSCIGLTETVSGFAQSDPNDPTQVGTIGKVMPGREVKMINEHGVQCQPGEIGEIYVKIPTAAFYYLKNYAKTKETFVGEWVKTGDCGYFDKNDNLVFAGRVDDTFKVGGLIVSPFEVESTILRQPSVSEAAVMGITGMHGDKELHAFIIPEPGFDLDQLKEVLSKQLFPHQIPRSIHIVQEFPETVTFKKDRRMVCHLVAEKKSDATAL